MVEKSRNFPNCLPINVETSIAPDSPSSSSNFESSEDWFKVYNTHLYRKSVFFKGPMLSLRPEFANLFDNEKYTTVNYKNKLKRKILELQTSGSEIEWDPQNFLIFGISGLRASKRNT